MRPLILLFAVPLLLAADKGAEGWQAERALLRLDDALGEETAAPQANIRQTGLWRLGGAGSQPGGFSGLALHHGALILLSDKGVLVRAAEPFDGRQTHLAVDSGVLPGPCGTPPSGVRVDSEALSVSQSGGALLVVMERDHALCRIPLDAPAEAERLAIATAQGWPGNAGFEAMIALPEGGLALFGGKRDGAGRTPVLIYPAEEVGPSAMPRRLLFAAPQGYTSADAAMLPDGRILVLNRRYRFPGGYDGLITLLPRLDQADQSLVEGRIVIRLAGANYEGMAVEPQGEGVRLWLVSDNNGVARRSSWLVRIDVRDPSQM